MEITPEMRAWAEAWKKAGPMLEAVEEKEWQEFDYGRSMRILSDAYEEALRQNPPRPWSGLVVLQKHLRRLHEENGTAL